VVGRVNGIALLVILAAWWVADTLYNLPDREA
jgi:hypothetical protein